VFEGKVQLYRLAMEIQFDARAEEGLLELIETRLEKARQVIDAPAEPRLAGSQSASGRP
jgi:hypothetical protein